MKHVIQRVTATPLRIKSVMTWLALARGRVSSMCLIQRLHNTPKDVIAGVDKAMEWHGTQSLPKAK